MGRRRRGFNLGRTLRDAGDRIQHTVVDPIATTTSDIADSIDHTIIDPIGTGTTDVIGTIGGGLTDAYRDTARAATDSYNYAVDLANDSGAVAACVAASVARITSEAASQGIDVSSEAWQLGSAQAVEFYKDGAEAVEKAAREAYAWLDANACYIGLNTMLTAGTVMYFTPKPDPVDPGTLNSVAISSTWLAAKAAEKAAATGKWARKTTLVHTIAYLITEALFEIPGLDGQIDKHLVERILVNVIESSIDNYYLWGTAEFVGIAIGSAISPVVATLVCEGIAPAGATRAIADFDENHALGEQTANESRAQQMRAS